MTSASDEPLLVTRARGLIATGTPPHEAWSLAEMEEILGRWPAEWGDELEVLIGGDFPALERDLTLPALGITVFRERLPNDAFCGALTVHRVRISVPGRNVAGYNDAIRRLNILLGSQAVLSWGASGLAWWCGLWGIIRSARVETFGMHADLMKRQLDRLPAGARERVEAALYWLREPRSHMGEASRPDAVRSFTSYWTALECLVSAGCDLVPMPSAAFDTLRKAIADLADSGGTVRVDAVRRAYRLANSGLPERARHVFRAFMPLIADHLIEECFTVTPSARRLASIRNAISHGGAKPEDLDALAVLQPAEARLRRVVWPLLDAILQTAV